MQSPAPRLAPGADAGQGVAVLTPAHLSVMAAVSLASSLAIFCLVSLAIDSAVPVSSTQFSIVAEVGRS